MKDKKTNTNFIDGIIEIDKIISNLRIMADSEIDYELKTTIFKNLMTIHSCCEKLVKDCVEKLDSDWKIDNDFGKKDSK